MKLFENIAYCAITFLYYKRYRKPLLVRLLCDIALEKCQEKPVKYSGYASCFTCFFRAFLLRIRQI